MSKLKQKGREILMAQSKINAPEFNVLDYDHSLLINLNYYSHDVDNKRKKAFALEFWSKEGKDIVKISKLDDSQFNTAGALAHMISVRNLGLTQSDLDKMDDIYNRLVEHIPSTNVVSKTVGTPVIKERLNRSSEYIAELEGAIDNLLTKDEILNVKLFITKNGIRAYELKSISDWFSARLKEYQEVLTDTDQLREGYSNLGKRGLNKLVNFVTDIVTNANDQILSLKSKKIKPTKKKPPIEVVKYMKYQLEESELGLKSVHPTKILESNEIYLYNVEYRRLIRVVGLDGGLSVAGTTITNFDHTKTTQKTVRKPEILKGSQSLGKKELRLLYDNLTSKDSPYTGRTNDNTIILTVY